MIRSKTATIPLESCHRSGREKEIIELLFKGYSNKQIGKALFISARTVKNHIYSIYRKTGGQEQDAACKQNKPLSHHSRELKQDHFPSFC